MDRNTKNNRIVTAAILVYIIGGMFVTLLVGVVLNIDPSGYGMSWIAFAWLPIFVIAGLIIKVGERNDRLKRDITKNVN